jgi:mannose-6-phosphate isomerase-like protein (cupin superfamily)
MLRREHGETITAREHRDVILLAADDDLSITWSRYAAGERGPGLHVHREHVDGFYVLEGELTFGVGPAGDPLRAGPGTLVAVPPHVAHGFANESAAEACWLNFHAPDQGFAAYLRDARDGNDAAFDSFDPPADGGRPASEVVVSARGAGDRLDVGGASVLLRVALPGLAVAEWTLDGAAPPPGHWWPLGADRVLSIGTVSPGAA